MDTFGVLYSWLERCPDLIQGCPNFCTPFQAVSAYELFPYAYHFLIHQTLLSCSIPFLADEILTALDQVDGAASRLQKYEDCFNRGSSLCYPELEITCSPAGIDTCIAIVSA